MPDRIARLAVLRIDSPLAMRRAHGSGEVARRVARVLVRLRTADGLEGLGEAAPWAPFGNTADTTAAAIDGPLRAALVGADAEAIASAVEAMDRALAAHPEAKAACEMALWDIAGKRLRAPITALFGGAVRRSIPLSFSIADPDVAADLDRARALAGEGIGIFKIKTGFLTHADDLDRIAALRETVPHAELRVDYNQGLRPEDAARFLRDLDGLELGFIEQPLARGQERTMARLAATLATPVMADESVFSASDMLGCVTGAWADCVSIKLAKAGGILRARAIDAIAEAAGIPTYAGTLWEGGIALAAAAHLAATLPNMRLGCEFYMPRYALTRDVTAERFPYAGGSVQVPDGPGLGMTLDEEAVAMDLVAVRE